MCDSSNFTTSFDIININTCNSSKHQINPILNDGFKLVKNKKQRKQQNSTDKFYSQHESNRFSVFNQNIAEEFVPSDEISKK